MPIPVRFMERCASSRATTWSSHAAMTTDVHRGTAVDAVERLLNRGGDADDVLRSIVLVLLERLPHLESVWIEFLEGEQRVGRPVGR